MIRTLIVDDEPLARQGLRQLLSDQKDIEILQDCSDGIDAIQTIEATSPDLVLLDIQMPEMSGLEVAANLSITPRPQLIFVTAFDQFAIEAFRVHALDYLLKPVKKADLLEALQRIRNLQNLKNSQDVYQKVDALIAVDQSYLKRLVVRGRNELRVIKTADIDWLEAAGDYVAIYIGSQKHLHRIRISDLESQLDPALFCRIHRSAIVQLDRIVSLNPDAGGDYGLQLSNGRKLTLSRTYREQLMSRL